MRAGELRHRVAIQERATASQGTRGEIADAWQDVRNVWAAIETLSGSELELARQTVANASASVTIRYTPGLTTANRLKYGPRILSIEHINNIDQRNIELVLLCGEAVA